jgi:glucokinase
MTEGILAADVGGTTTRLRLCRRSDLQVVAEQHYASPNYPDLQSILSRFLEGQSGFDLQAACVAVAGPVRHGQARVTNLPWIVTETELAEKLGTSRVSIVNDFEAIGHVLPYLPAEDFSSLQVGQPDPTGTRLIIGAGTGLGTAILTRCGTDWKVLPGEGGHMDFAPRGGQQQDLLNWLLQGYPRVSIEMLVSGPGLERIYAFLAGGGAQSKEKDWPDAAVISNRALAGEEKLAMAALDLFVSIYAAQAANLALVALSTGGVFLAGGIAPRLQSKLDDGSFITTFDDKPPMSDLLVKMPVNIILNSQAGLEGAARLARSLALASTT